MMPTFRQLVTLAFMTGRTTGAETQERGGLFLPAVRDVPQVLINRVQLVKDLPDSLPLMWGL